VETHRRAIIDVGTNSIKLLVADVRGRHIEPVWEGSKQTRLGRGFYPTQRLLPGAIARAAAAVAEFVTVARNQGAEPIRLIATSAAREARNADELARAVAQAAGLDLEILSGDEEADLVFQGVTTDPALANCPLLLLDVGGGSTEFIVGQGEEKFFRASVPLGSVRLMETLPHGDPPGPEDLSACRDCVSGCLARQVEPGLLPHLQALARGTSPGGQIDAPADAGSPALLRLVGTGGTATILARVEAGLENYDRARIEATRLSRDRLRWHVEHLWSLPLEQRKQVVGLPPSRADVILYGAVIYEAVMERFDFTELTISARGLRFAAVLR
jgi:exopolyphosphatase / guanosine-5'-triphosphate,3'-diphosphate pyrophosphatase